MKCLHEIVHCLNHYDTFRKYKCEECKGVFICECERELVLTFLPHQVRFGSEYGTQKRYSVTGFAPNMCAKCRGEKEEAYPRAAIYGQKGKVERYYWREIFKTYCEYILDWMHEQDIGVTDIIEIESRFPQKAKELKKLAKKYWQDVHKKSPKYDLKEITEASFLSEINIPIRELNAEYVQVEREDQKIGKWVNYSGELCSAEQIVSEWYESEEYTVKTCERKLISTWVGTFLALIIQDPNDPRSRLVMRGSTRGWTPNNRNTPIIKFLLPEDFASKEYYERRYEAFTDWFKKLENSGNLITIFEALLESSTLLRDYLWVNEDDAVELARSALHVIPPELVLASVKWAIRDFWNRRPGWPDLFMYKNNDYLFVEVKSPHDKLSQEQMNWFRWAIEESNIRCEICRIKKV